MSVIHVLHSGVHIDYMFKYDGVNKFYQGVITRTSPNYGSGYVDCDIEFDDGDVFDDFRIHECDFVEPRTDPVSITGEGAEAWTFSDPSIHALIKLQQESDKQCTAVKRLKRSAGTTRVLALLPCMYVVASCAYAHREAITAWVTSTYEAYVDRFILTP